MTNYITCAQTAKLIRKALKEAFPGQKFSVRSSTYSMGASIRIAWTDGPTRKQVDQVAQTFAGATFDGMTDYKGGKVHLLNGEPVHFGADFIFCEREITESLAEKHRQAWDLLNAREQVQLLRGIMLHTCNRDKDPGRALASVLPPFNALPSPTADSVKLERTY